MSIKIENIIDEIIRVEGGYVNHPDDKGGPTCWGITETVARKHGWTGPMHNLPKTVARAIYLEDYVVKPGFARVATISEKIAFELVDSGVNCGVGFPCLWLQSTLNVSNMKQKIYPDLKEDGVVGNVTINALSQLLYYRGVQGEEFVLKCLNVLQGARYFEITKAREKNETHFYGWIMNRVNL